MLLGGEKQAILRPGRLGDPEIPLNKSAGGIDKVYRQGYNRHMSEVRLQVSNLLNYSESARILGVTRATIYAMIERGELHPIAIADRRYLLREEVERLKKEKSEPEVTRNPKK